MGMPSNRTETLAQPAGTPRRSAHDAPAGFARMRLLPQIESQRSWPDRAEMGVDPVDLGHTEEADLDPVAVPLAAPPLGVENDVARAVASVALDRAAPDHRVVERPIG